MKTVNNKMAINMYLSTIESKNKLNKNRDRIMDMESIFMVASREGSVGEWVRGEGIKKCK